MRNARGVFRDAAVVGERCYRFSVLEARRAQSKPLGLEDGDTRFAEALAGYFFQQRHGTGSRLPARHRRKSEEGEPVTRLPLSEPYGPAGLTWMTGGPRILVYRLTRPQPPSSVQRKRRCGLWLW